MPTSALKPWADNPRFNADSVPKVAELILEHGFAGTLVATPDGIIRAGHTRHAALDYLRKERKKLRKLLRYGSLTQDQKERWKKLRRQDFTKVWVNWKNFGSVEQAERYALSDNKANEWSDWDHTKLAKMFVKRRKAELNVLEKQTGFKAREITWQGPDAIDKDEIEDIDEEEATFVLRIDGIHAKHREKVLTLVQDVLKEEKYVYLPKLY